MSLPKLNTPTYELKLSSIKEPVKYRPFLVKEEKLMMIASETGDEKNIINSGGNHINLPVHKKSITSFFLSKKGWGSILGIGCINSSSSKWIFLLIVCAANSCFSLTAQVGTIL